MGRAFAGKADLSTGNMKSDCVFSDTVKGPSSLRGRPLAFCTPGMTLRGRKRHPPGGRLYRAREEGNSRLLRAPSAGASGLFRLVEAGQG